MSNVYFTPIATHFNPLPPCTIHPNRITKFLSGGRERADADLVSAVVSGLGLGAFGLSYVVSPNVQVPLQILNLTGSLYREDPIAVLFSSILLGLAVKYAQDGALTKLSNDLFAFSKEAEGVVEKLDKGCLTEVSLVEAPLLEENSDQIGCVRSIIRYINSIIVRIFRAFSDASLVG